MDASRNSTGMTTTRTCGGHAASDQCRRAEVISRRRHRRRQQRDGTVPRQQQRHAGAERCHHVRHAHAAAEGARAVTIGHGMQHGGCCGVGFGSSRHLAMRHVRMMIAMTSVFHHGSVGQRHFDCRMIFIVVMLQLHCLLLRLLLYLLPIVQTCQKRTRKRLPMPAAGQEKATMCGVWQQSSVQSRAKQVFATLFQTNIAPSGRSTRHRRRHAPATLLR